jgi:UDP-glucuronate 4-epimerase
MTMQTLPQAWLVTGGAGFIGSHLVNALLSLGHRITVVDDFNDYYAPAIKHANLAPVKQHPNLTIYPMDINDIEGLQSVFALHGHDWQTGGIVHLAARAGVRPSLEQPHLYCQTNIAGTLNLLELTRQFKIPRFVLASSSSVYGDSPKSIPFHEELDVSRPISPYAASKVAAENMLYTYHHLYGIQAVALRFFTVYGPSQRPDLAIHKFTNRIYHNKPIAMFGDGSTRRDYTYINDIIQGVLAAMSYNASPFEIVNLGESQTTSLIDLIAHIEQALGKTAIIEQHPLQLGDVPITYANIDKAKRLLGYQPTTLIAQGIPKFVDWYLRQTAIMASCTNITYH